MRRYSEVVQGTPRDAPKTLYARDKDDVLKHKKLGPSMRPRVGIYFDQLGRRGFAFEMIKHGPLKSLATDRAIDLSPSLGSTRHTSNSPLSFSIRPKQQSCRILPKTAPEVCQQPPV
jgi:hypothetical protein